MGLPEILLQLFDVLAWPLLALVYPMWCSVRAIEANSHSYSQRLNSYWVVFSLSLLFEHGLSMLLECLPLWPYIRIMIVVWLVTPHFHGAYYVYKHLVCPCLTVDPQLPINWFNKWRTESSCIRENFLAEVERYIKENGPEAVERIVACKGSRAEPNLTEIGYSKVAAMELKEKSFEVETEKELLKTLPSNKVQDWTSAISQVTTQSNATLKSYLNAEYETLKIKNQVKPMLTQLQNRKSAPIEAQVNPVEVATCGEFLESSQEVQNEWTSALWKVIAPSETTLNSELKWWNYKATHDGVKAKQQVYVPKISPASTVKCDKHEETRNITPSRGLDNLSAEVAAGREVLQSSQKVQKERTRALCEVTTPSETTQNSESKRWNNKAAHEGQKAKYQVYVPKVASTSTVMKADKHEEPENITLISGIKRTVVINGKVQGQENTMPASIIEKVDKSREKPAQAVSSRDLERKTVIDFMEKVEGQHRNPHEVPRTRDSRLWCTLCGVNCSGEIDLACHLKGRKHSENVREQLNANRVQRKNAPPLWCKTCEVGCYTEFDMECHLNGRRHWDCLSATM